ncbi:mas-related G-protein coupled receptor member B4-like [Numida meleagris]|uniref:mas-related G-protein coupled receptor member B4-like n=1 Tax=Numida meleagris TaxID=8996 RepID=UPI000B3E0E2C|nr:mas-related G-protein coupled receptor member B4-like [Numida meleagris]XP_021256808.1 mas-related G-protein coupled receptor member B4-like [Numida meleagris]
MSTPLPSAGKASPPCWSQPGTMTHGRAWHHGLPRQAGSYTDDYDWTHCEDNALSKAPVTMLICLCGLVGNGAVLWLLRPHVRRNFITVYILNLATADFAFLFSILIALTIFYGPQSFCHSLGSQDMTTVLNVAITFAFVAGVYLMAALGARTCLPALPWPFCPCQPSWCLPALLCALLWALALLLTVSLYFSPVMLVVFVLSYLLSVLILILSGLALFAKVLCCSLQYPPRKLCIAVLLSIIAFPFLTAGFAYWLLLRLFDFSVLIFDTSLLFTCLNSSIKPVLYFLAGCCMKKFTVSVRVACQRAFEEVTESENIGETPPESTVEMDV